MSIKQVQFIQDIFFYHIAEVIMDVHGRILSDPQTRNYLVLIVIFHGELNKIT